VKHIDLFIGSCRTWDRVSFGLGSAIDCYFFLGSWMEHVPTTNGMDMYESFEVEGSGCLG
jgi:hypothetical protein